MNKQNSNDNKDIVNEIVVKDETEVNEIVKEYEGINGLQICVLKNPIYSCGEKIKELKFDFNSLTANDVITCSTEASTRRKNNEVVFFDEFDKVFQACLAAKAANIQTELIMSLNANDFIAVCRIARSFLLNGE